MLFRLVLFLCLGFAASASCEELPPTLDGVLGVLSANPIKDIDDLLPYFPMDLRTSHTYMHHSKSSQSVSYENPRAILFRQPSKSSRKEIFAAAFNGHPGSRGYDRLELMLYNPSPKPGETTFELYAISFPPKRDAQGKVTPPVKNPSECLACHRENPRPIWGRYPEWPGAYGSFDDELRNPEDTHFSEFHAFRKDLPRYRRLKPPDDSGLGPYGNGVATLYRPNLRLGALSNRLNAQRLHHMMQDSALYSRFRSVTLWYGTWCANKEYRNAFGENDAKDIARIEAALREELGHWEDPPAKVSLFEALSWKRFLAIEGIEEADLDLEKGEDPAKYDDYWDGSFAMSDVLHNEIFRELKGLYPELAPYYQPKGYSDKYKIPDDAGFHYAVDDLGKGLNQSPVVEDDRGDFMHDVYSNRKFCQRLFRRMKDEVLGTPPPPAPRPSTH